MEKFKGCNDDCFNCRYSDCLKPSRLIYHKEIEFKEEKETNKTYLDICRGGLNNDNRNDTGNFKK